jgi:hypothetical protein
MKIKAILALALALACGGVSEDEPVIEQRPSWPVTEPSPDAVEINGELFWELDPVVDYVPGFGPTELDESAFDDAESEPTSIDKRTYTIPNGYGIAVGGVQCLNPSWAGGQCKIPKVKQACVLHKPDTEPPSSTMAAQAEAGLTAWLSYMSSKWTVGHDDIGCAFATEGQVRIKWGNLGAGVMGKMTPLANSGDFFSITQGEVRPWKHAEITLDPSEILAMPGFSGKTGTQKDRFVQNVQIHELDHAAGLAHNGIIDTLMAASPEMPPTISSAYSKVMSPLSSEGVLITSYTTTP